jgi:hypothetical protein
MNRGRETPWPKLGRAQARGIGHEKQQGFFLLVLEVERNSFYTLTVKETDEGRPTTGKQLKCSTMAA